MWLKPVSPPHVGENRGGKTEYADLVGGQFGYCCWLNFFKRLRCTSVTRDDFHFTVLVQSERHAIYFFVVDYGAQCLQIHIFDFSVIGDALFPGVWVSSPTQIFTWSLDPSEFFYSITTKFVGTLATLLRWPNLLNFVQCHVHLLGTWDDMVPAPPTTNFCSGRKVPSIIICHTMS